MNNNISTNRSQQPLQICDFYVKVETDVVDIFTVAINLVFAVSAIVGNALVLLAIRRTTALWLPTKILLCSLAFADLGVGLIAQPFFAFKLYLKTKCLAVSWELRLISCLGILPSLRL